MHHFILTNSPTPKSIQLEMIKDIRKYKFTKLE